jgi:hypothetical protein
VGLTESKVKDLKDKKFDNLFKKHKEVWLKMAANAHEFAKKHITDGNEPRDDDILKPLLTMLEVNEDLRKHQEDNHARYRRFREFFGDFIVDQYKHPPKEEKK